MFNKLVEEINPEIILIEYIWLTRLVTGLKRKIRKQLFTVVDTHDVASSRTEQFEREKQSLHYRANIEQEKEAIKNYDLIIAIQSHDAEIFSEMLPGASIIVAYHSLPIKKPVKRIVGAKANILFVGSNNAPNTDGLNLFLMHVWERLLEIYSRRIVLNIVGSISNNANEFYTKEGLVIHGIVDSLDDYYDSADIVIAPLTYGTGLKIKVVEALCFSKPLITTYIGADGLDEGINTAFMIGRDWREFEDKMIELLDSPEKRYLTACAAYDYSHSMFDEKVAYRELIDCLNVECTAFLE